MLRLDTTDTESQDRVIDVVNEISVAPTASDPADPADQTTPTTVAPVAAATATQDAALQLGDEAAVAKNWAGFVLYSEFDAGELLKQAFGDIPLVPTSQRHVVVALGLRYTGTDAIGETSSLRIGLIGRDGTTVGRSCAFGENVFRDRFVVPFAVAEYLICSVVPIDQIDSLVVRIIDSDTSAFDLALHQDIGQPTKQVPPNPVAISGPAGSSGAPARIGTDVNLGSWYSITLDSVTREPVPTNGAPDSVIVRVKWTLTTTSTDVQAATTQFVYGAFGDDGLQRSVRQCDATPTPPPKPGGDVVVELCTQLPEGSAATFFVHERHDRTVSYFTVPAV